MEDAKCFIPTELHVGFNNRSDTFTGKLAYVTYINSKGKLAKEKSWKGWIDPDIPTVKMENKPTKGYVINKSLERRAYYFGHDVTKFRIHHPDGFEFEIMPENISEIIRWCDINHGEIQDELIFAWYGANLILMPVACEQYQTSLRHTEKALMRTSSKDLVDGGQYHHKVEDGTMTYIGRRPYFKQYGYSEFSRLYRSHKNGSSKATENTLHQINELFHSTFTDYLADNINMVDIPQDILSTMRDRNNGECSISGMVIPANKPGHVFFDDKCKLTTPNAVSFDITSTPSSLIADYTDNINMNYAAIVEKWINGWINRGVFPKDITPIPHKNVTSDRSTTIAFDVTDCVPKADGHGAKVLLHINSWNTTPLSSVIGARMSDGTLMHACDLLVYVLQQMLNSADPEVVKQASAFAHYLGERSELRSRRGNSSQLEMIQQQIRKYGGRLNWDGEVLTGICLLDTGLWDILDSRHRYGNAVAVSGLLFSVLLCGSIDSEVKKWINSNICELMTLPCFVDARSNCSGFRSLGIVYHIVPGEVPGSAISWNHVFLDQTTQGNRGYHSVKSRSELIYDDKVPLNGITSPNVCVSSSLSLDSTVEILSMMKTYISPSRYNVDTFSDMILLMCEYFGNKRWYHHLPTDVDERVKRAHVHISDYLYTNHYTMFKSQAFLDGIRNALPDIVTYDAFEAQMQHDFGIPDSFLTRIVEVPSFFC